MPGIPALFDCLRDSMDLVRVYDLLPLLWCVSLRYLIHVVNFFTVRSVQLLRDATVALLLSCFHKNTLLRDNHEGNTHASTVNDVLSITITCII